MKHPLALLVLALCACVKDPSFSPDGAAKGLSDNTIDIHIVAGQSNATGQGLVSSLSAPYVAPIRNALIWNYAAGTLDTLRAGINNEAGGCGGVIASNAHGIELSFMHRLCSQSRKTTILLKRAYNASRLYPITTGSPNPWEAPDALGVCNPQYTWHPNDPASQYHGLLAECIALRNHVNANLNKVPKFRSVVWYQGESDGPYIQRAQAWGANMQAMVNRLKLDLNEPNLKVVIVRTTRNLAGYAYMDTVRVCQVSVANQANWRWVNADPWVNQGQMHANSDDLVAIGIAAADTLTNMP